MAKWYVKLSCTCGGCKTVESREFSKNLFECPECREDMRPLYYQYDMETAISGGIGYINSCLLKNSKYKKLPGLDQWKIGGIL